MANVFLSKNIDKILSEIDFAPLTGTVAIKLHFGERGCNTYIKPDLVKIVYNKLSSLGEKASLVECNVLYRGSRTNTTDHIQTAKTHGFDFAPIDILDGHLGQQFFDVPLTNTLAKNAKLGKGLLKYDSLIALTHVTAHEATGFAGVFKNLGMGLASRAGKLHMHSEIKPSIDPEKCTACRTCIEHCNSDAIRIQDTSDHKAVIDAQLCIGCAMCIAVCPEKAVKVPWHGSTTDDLQKKIVDYASAVLKTIKNKAVFINVLENITRDCDCLSKKQSPVIPDIGILMSDDILAVEKASFDLINKASKGQFTRLHPVNYSTQIDYAKQISLGSTDYQIINLD